MRRIALPLVALAMTSCATVSPEPAAYHALGTEPGWSLSISALVMRFSGPYGQNPVSEPTPRVIHGFAGEIYRGQRINVNIVHGRCTDGMSDRVYPDSVQLGVDGKSFKGCGGL
ncbi:MAG: hypothetical protein M3N02_01830 [Pseudomonadota bacterium]|jgi:heat shock protein HslJ|nr:hypothetical protein [Pseudomonadota bacterium]